MKSGRIAIIEQFIKDGICYMFGNPGTVEQGFLDLLKDYPKLKYILSLQESIAVGIADGYARKTKRATLVQLHTGVGLGNGIGMIYQAMRGHAPLLVIAGESGVMYDSMDAQMACDLVGMAKPVTKWATRILDNRSILRVMRRAIKIASTPPMGPVFVSLPMDVLDAECVEEVVPTSRLNTSTFVDDKTLEGVANILLSAKNPMIIMGDGIAFSGAQNALSELSALVGCQVWGADSSEVNINTSSANFKGLLGHMFGYHSKPFTSSADAVLICGTYVLPEVFPELESIFKNNAKIVHIDLEAYEIAKRFHPAWDKLNQYSKNLIARTSHVIFGEKLDDPVRLIIAYTPQGKIIGGTGQALRIARAYGIKTFNLGTELGMRELSSYIKIQHSISIEHQKSIDSYF